MKASLSFTSAVLGALLSITSTSATPIPDAPSTVEKRCSPFDVEPEIFANSTKIDYQGGGWTQLKNQGSRDYGGVEAYSGNACAYYTFEYPLPFGGFTIWAGKKDDRGFFDVWAGNNYLGAGDAYDANCKSDCPTAQVFNGYLNYTYESGTIITVRNRPHDSRLARGTPYLDLNYISTLGGNC